MIHVKITLFQGPRNTEYNICEAIVKQILSLLSCLDGALAVTMHVKQKVSVYVSACFKLLKPVTSVAA